MRRHLERVVTSKAFAGSKRSQDFLRLILEHALAGRPDNLRERMIGAEMFGRPIDYDTANDAVVRVKANEVRRRLAQYYAEQGTEHDGLWIDLPTGTYVPEFRWVAVQAASPAPPEAPPDPQLPLVPLKATSPRPWGWIAISVVLSAALLAVSVNSIRNQTKTPSTAVGNLSRLTFDSGYTTDGEISADGRLMAYASDRENGDNLDIYVQDIERGSVARFTEDPADDYDPAFSPDGSQIAFRSERNGGGIYQVSTMRSAAHLVVPGGRRPRFSPDGRYLLYWQAAGGFKSRWGGLSAKLFTVEVSGGSPVEISRNCSFVNTGAVWAPDSKQVLFAGICQGRSGIWLASPDGQVLKSSDLYSLWKKQKLQSLDWSTAAVFDQWLDSPAHLLLPLTAGDDVSYEAGLPVGLDGTPTGPVQPVVFGPSRVTHASASRDGRIILSTEEQSSDIWMLKVDSSGRAVGGPIPLRTGSLINIEPALSKDGKNVVFVARESGAWELQLINLLNGALTHLSVRLPYLHAPVFNSKGDKVYYSGQLPRSEKVSDYELAVDSAVPQTMLEKSPGGLWDESPAEPWLITHSRIQVSSPMGVSYDANLPMRDTLALLDRNTRQVRPFLSDPNGNLYQGHFSHDGAWVTFLDVQNQHSKIYVVPFSSHEVPIASWIPISDGATWDDKPNFSFDDKLIFFTSDKDGSRCIWAQRLTGDMHPSGSPFAVCHFHSRRRSLANLPIGRMSLAVGPGTLVFNQGEYTGNLWLHDQK